MAVLALFTADNRGKSLADYLDQEVFVASAKCHADAGTSQREGVTNNLLTTISRPCRLKQAAGEAMKLD